METTYAVHGRSSGTFFCSVGEYCRRVVAAAALAFMHVACKIHFPCQQQVVSNAPMRRLITSRLMINRHLMKAAMSHQRLEVGKVTLSITVIPVDCLFTLNL